MLHAFFYCKKPKAKIGHLLVISLIELNYYRNIEMMDDKCFDSCRQKDSQKQEDDMCTKNELNSILQKVDTDLSLSIWRKSCSGNFIRLLCKRRLSYGFRCRCCCNRAWWQETLQQQLKKVWDSSCELELEYDTILSPTVIPYEEFKQYQTVLPYYRNISQEGVVISAW